VKKLILIIGLATSTSIFAQEVPEASWRASFREVIERFLGNEWGDRILGKLPNKTVDEISMPEIPTVVKKSTDITTYSKKSKQPTEFDKLPQNRKRSFNYKFIEELFLVTRKTQAKDEDFSNWLNTLDQGGSREGIYQSLVLDEVYSGLESIEERPSKILMDFCLRFSQKFLRQTFKSQSLEKLNLYSLKRIFTEKGLDILDFYEVRDLDSLYRWYANLSADFARDHNTILNSQIRKNPSARYHYEWAKGMPVQHIKSEFIIKVHSIMNGIQLRN
jgi:hypothetical protein